MRGSAKREGKQVGQRGDGNGDTSVAHRLGHPLLGARPGVGGLEGVDEHKHVVDANAEEDERKDGDDRIHFEAEKRREAVGHANREDARDDARDGEERARARRVEAEEDEQGVGADENETDVDLDDVAADVGAEFTRDCASRLREDVDHCRVPHNRSRARRADRKVLISPLGADEHIELVLPGECSIEPHVALRELLQVVGERDRLGPGDPAVGIVREPAEGGLHIKGAVRIGGVESLVDAPARINDLEDLLIGPVEHELATYAVEEFERMAED
mmetsp:Transcript_27168/g.82403  ORF Transcript_27168/g.82403 Transcript_27168/m.82403 type:complete len:274 (-) Transcript_27168:450-1271(-)